MKSDELRQIVEPFDGLLRIRIRSRGDVVDFRDLGRVVRALSSIDRRVEEGWPRADYSDTLLDFEDSRRERARLVSFSVQSPPDFELLTNPLWVTIFVTGLLHYKGIKENVAELKKDAAIIISDIQGLTQAQRAALEIGVVLYLEDLSRAGEKGGQAFARWCRRFRRALAPGRQPPAISVGSDPQRKLLS